MTKSLSGFRGTRQRRRTLRHGSANRGFSGEPDFSSEVECSRKRVGLTLISRVGPDGNALDIVLRCADDGRQRRRDEDGGPRKVAARTGGRDLVTGPLSSDGRVVLSVGIRIPGMRARSPTDRKAEAERERERERIITNAASRISIASSTGKRSCCRISSTSSTSE